MEDSFDKSCDVLIIGAGMAGSCLARQLSLEQPELDVIVIDAKTEFDWWVGESTIEVFDDYAIRVLKLGPYLESKHITKHGPRFWFDSEQKDLRLTELSEQGRSRYTTLNRGIQIDRAIFDRDLCEINRKNGVEVLLGVRVQGQERAGGDPGIEIDGQNGHLVRTSAGTIRCRHLVDAGGRSSNASTATTTTAAAGSRFGATTRASESRETSSTTSSLRSSMREASTTRAIAGTFTRRPNVRRLARRPSTWTSVKRCTKRTCSIGSVTFDTTSCAGAKWTTYPSMRTASSGISIPIGNQARHWPTSSTP